MAHSRETAMQVTSEYVETMGKVYFSYFKDYYSKLMKLQVCDCSSWEGACPALVGSCQCIVGPALPTNCLAVTVSPVQAL